MSIDLQFHPNRLNSGLPETNKQDALNFIQPKLKYQAMDVVTDVPSLLFH